MKFFASGAELAKEMGIDGKVLVDTHNAHYEAAKKQEADPEGGKWPAYPSGKCHDEASGKTGSGKKFYHNYIEGSKVLAEPFYVAIITPVIHYCMGGLEIDVNSSVMSSNGNPIPGLYCAGEVAGGVHGNNRLGGNSLLDCVVFGRVSGRHCAKYMLGDEFKPVDLKGLVPKEDQKKKQPAESAPAAGAAAPAAPAAGDAKPAEAAPESEKITWKQRLTRANAGTASIGAVVGGAVGCVCVIHAPWLLPAAGLAVVAATELPCLKK